MDIARNCVFDSNTKTVAGLCGVRCLGSIEIFVNVRPFLSWKWYVITLFRWHDGNCRAIVTWRLEYAQ